MYDTYIVLGGSGKPPREMRDMEAIGNIEKVKQATDALGVSYSMAVRARQAMAQATVDLGNMGDTDARDEAMAAWRALKEATDRIEAIGFFQQHKGRF